MAKTNFQIFNEENAPERTYNDSEYKEATQRLGGVMPGMALSRMHNKMYYQWSAMCKAIANLIVNHGHDCMDSDVAGITRYLDETITNAADTEVKKHRTKTPLDHPDGSVTTAKLADKSVTSAKLAVSAGELGAYTKAETDARLNTKAPLSHGHHIPTPEAANNTRFLRNDNSWAAVTPGNIGAYTKTETDERLASKAPLASPALTGTPTAPTAGRGTNSTQIATTAFVVQAITALINGAPGALDTLQELAKALGNDANFAATVTNALAGKVAKSGDTMTGRLTAPSVLVDDWFRALGDCGLLFEKYGGGWHMTDNEWIRAYDGKNIYTTGKIRCNAGFEGSLRGTADNANKLGDKSLQWMLEQIKAANTGIVASNLQQNGWIKFANGIILQWGSWGESVQEKSQWFTFPLAFPSRCFKAIVGTSLLQEHINADLGYQVIALERTRAKIMTQHFSTHILNVLGQIKAAPEFIAIGI